MTIKVYIGTRSNAQQLTIKQAILYPETTVDPEHLYDTLRQISVTMRSNHIDTMNIVTLSPIVLNATEVLALRESLSLQWFECKNGCRRPCLKHEKVYKKFANTLQSLDNLQYADED